MKSNKGYSLIEIGVGILILAVFMLVSIGLFNGCYTNYRRIKQRNIAIDSAVKYMEDMIQTDSNILTGFMKNEYNEDIEAYELTPNDLFKDYVHENYEEKFKSRYTTYTGESAPESLTGDDLKEYIRADTEYLVNCYIEDYLKDNRATSAQKANGSYAFFKAGSEFTGDAFTEIINTTSIKLNDNSTNKDEYEYVNSNGTPLMIKKTISRIPSVGNKAYGNNVLKLRVDVYYSYDLTRNLTEENTEVITLESIKIVKKI